MKRRCELCDSPLASYNPGPRCYAHTEGEIIHEVVPRNACPAPLHGGMCQVLGKQGEVLPPSGSEMEQEGYNDTAFSRYPVGQVRADGTVRYFNEEEEAEEETE